MGRGGGREARPRSRRTATGPTSTSRSCSAATGRCSARSTAFSAPSVPVIGVNFGRVGFLSSIPRDELETGLARVFAGEYKIEELPTLEVEVGDERRVAVNDLVVTSERRRADDPARVGRRRRGSRPPRLRRRRLLDSVGLDGLQLLERRASARLGPGRDGGDVRGAALAQRPAARHPARTRPDRLEPNAGRARDRARRRAPRRRPAARRRGRSPASARSAPCSRRCPR